MYVYDVISEGYQDWTGPAICGGLGVFFLLCLIFERYVRKISSRSYSVGMLVVACAFCFFEGTVSFAKSYESYRAVIAGVRSGDVRVVEGVVSQFKPAVLGRGSAFHESFVVNGEKFEYSDNSALGFHYTRAVGGPIRDGLHIRVEYLSLRGQKIITRLDIQN